MKRALLLLVVAACGGKVEEIGDGTTSTAGVPTGTTTSVPPSPGSPGSPGDPTPLPPKPGAPSDPPPPSTKLITAVAQPGGLDRLTIFAADKIADSCVRVQLVSPSMKTAFPNIVTPKTWAVQGITRSPGAGRCGPGKQPPAAEDATDAKGTITFGPSVSFYPCSIDVHVAALFAAKPTFEQLDGDKIAVEGCQ